VGQAVSPAEFFPPAAIALDRRAFLLALAPLLACDTRRAAGFSGYAFVANEEGRTIAAVDLSTFTVRKEIPIEGNPSALISYPRAIYALTPQTGTVHEIDPASLTVTRKTQVAPTALSMRLAADGQSLWILSRDSRALVQLSLDTLRTATRIKLPAVPGDFDLSSESAAISFPAEAAFAIAALRQGRIERVVPTGRKSQLIRFYDRGRMLVCGDGADRTVSIFEVARARAVVDLPLSIEPQNFCFKPDEGQLFVTGKGMDAVVVVQPYQSIVYETRFAGSSPGAMALSREYLFVANQGSGNLTVMDIVTGKIAATVAVGAEPRSIAVTPDNQYAMAVNSRSGDMAVIRVDAFSSASFSSKLKTAPTALLFTLIPVGSKPVAVAIRSA
jgi:YVTN family beta-propeller protein